LICQRNEAQKTNDIDICFGRVERSEFGALADPECCGIDARRLPPDLMDRRESIEQDLPYHHRNFVAVEPFAVVEWRRHD